MHHGINKTFIALMHHYIRGSHLGYKQHISVDSNPSGLLVILTTGRRWCRRRSRSHYHQKSVNLEWFPCRKGYLRGRLEGLSPVTTNGDNNSLLSSNKGGGSKGGDSSEETHGF